MIDDEEHARRLARAILEDLVREAGEGALDREAELAPARALYASKVAMPLVTLLDDEIARRRAQAPETLGGEEPRAPAELQVGLASASTALAIALAALVAMLAGLLFILRSG